MSVVLVNYIDLGFLYPYHPLWKIGSVFRVLGMYNFGTGLKINRKLGQDLKLGKEIMNLVFCARGYMKPGLSHNWHVQVVHKCHFKTFGTLVVITVVKGLDVEEHGVPIVFASFCNLKRKRTNVK